MQLKRVKVTAREVHDGLGGRHYEGETPTLPAEIADLFVAKNMAIHDEEDSRSQDEAVDAPNRQRGQKRK